MESPVNHKNQQCVVVCVCVVCVCVCVNACIALH